MPTNPTNDRTTAGESWAVRSRNGLRPTVSKLIQSPVHYLVLPRGSVCATAPMEWHESVSQQL